MTDSNRVKTLWAWLPTMQERLRATAVASMGVVLDIARRAGA